MSVGPLIFGTDGIRDRPGHGYLTPEAVEALAGATSLVLGRAASFPTDFPSSGGDTILLARDTRASGPAISGILADTFASYGHRVVDVGVLPTPGAACVSLAWAGRVALGIVVSASHNPAEYNGIKFVSPTGAKTSTEFEKAVSDAFWERRTPAPSAARGAREDGAGEALETYARWLVAVCRGAERLRGRTVVLDAANGAAHAVAPEVFRRLGMRVDAMADRPDGHNINDGCGALHPEPLARRVVESGADFGFSYDGDGDRMIPVTARGTVLDGDHVLYLAGRGYRRGGRLPRSTVVATVMSNIGLEIALRREGIGLLRTDVGDRNVFLAMVAEGHPVGGEQSGHLIFLDELRTGDGVLASLKLLDIVEGDLGEEAAGMVRYPQILRNVRVPEKRPLTEIPGVTEAIDRARASLGTEGRVVVRYSGTEPLLRVMLEGPEEAWIEGLSREICAAVRSSFRADAPSPRGD